MITNNTALILGAGSSHEAGFPLGGQLIKEIYSFIHEQSSGYRRVPSGNIVPFDLENVNLLQRLLELAGEKRQDGNIFSIEDIKKFTKDLWDSKAASIDDFLYHRKEFAIIGKLCILFVLSKYEDANRFFPKNPFGSSSGKWDYPNWGWYHYLWNQLQDGTEGSLENLKKNRLCIITFNYDRSLEYFLFNAIKATYGLEGKECEIASFFDTVQILHVYGELGVLPWKFNCLNEYREKFKSQPDAINNFLPIHLGTIFRLIGNPGEFGFTHADWGPAGPILDNDIKIKFAKELVDKAKAIKIYHEVAPNDDRYVNILSTAKRVYFLGCGYHQQNLEAIRLNASLPKIDAPIFGSAIGFSKLECNQISTNLKLFTNDNAYIPYRWEGYPDGHQKIESFLRNLAPLSTI